MMELLKRFGKQLVDVYLDYDIIRSTMNVKQWFGIIKQYIKEKKVCVIPSEISTVGWTERFLTDWLKNNHQIIGFKEITEERTQQYYELKKQMKFDGFPDFLVNQDGCWKRLEIECFSSDYNHGNDYAEIVLCYEADVPLPVQEVIEFKKLRGCKEIIIDREIWEYLYLFDQDFKKEYDEQMAIAMQGMLRKIQR